MDELDTPEEGDYLDYTDHETDWEGLTPPPQKHIWTFWLKTKGVKKVSIFMSIAVCLLPEPSAPSRGGASEPHDPIPTYSAEEERQDVRLWRTVIIGEQEHRINMKIIEPYMRVISHGGEDAASRRPHQKRLLKKNKTQEERIVYLDVFLFSQGYYGNEVNAIIVFAACFLPDSDREDYHEIMENLFL